MGPPFEDPTAGSSARAIAADPGAPRRIGDPTDPRYGQLWPVSSKRAGDAPRAPDRADANDETAAAEPASEPRDKRRH